MNLFRNHQIMKFILELLCLRHSIFSCFDDLLSHLSILCGWIVNLRIQNRWRIYSEFFPHKFNFIDEIFRCCVILNGILHINHRYTLNVCLVAFDSFSLQFQPHLLFSGIWLFIACKVISLNWQLNHLTDVLVAYIRVTTIIVHIDVAIFQTIAFNLIISLLSSYY